MSEIKNPEAQPKYRIRNHESEQPVYRNAATYTALAIGAYGVLKDKVDPGVKAIKDKVIGPKDRPKDG